VPPAGKNLFLGKILHIQKPLIKSFLGVQGAILQKSPLVAEGKKNLIRQHCPALRSLI
jgi:hypothetical protein